jgi:acetyl esterase/lipase
MKGLRFVCVQGGSMFDGVIVSARGIVAACVLLPVLLFPAHAASGPPAEDFTKPPAIAQAVISPTGKRVALRMLGHDGLHVAAVIDADQPGAPRRVAAFHDANVIDIAWLNDDRLVYVAQEPEAQIGLNGRGAFAVNHDGSDQRQLTAWRTSNHSTGTRLVERTLNYQWHVYAPIGDGSNDVWMQRIIEDGQGDLQDRALGRLNTVTGVLTTMSRDMPGGTSGWLFDAKREPRVLRVVRDGRSRIYWREPGSSDWQQVADFDLFTDEGFAPQFLESDTELLVRARAGADTVGLYTFDLKGRRLLPDPIALLKGFDLDDPIVTDRAAHKVLGLRVTTERPAMVWFDDRLTRVQAAIDAALPERFNLIDCGHCMSAQRFLVTSLSDRRPAEYLLYDPGKGTLQRLGSSRQWIDEKTQGRRTSHRVPARDGLALPVYITHPPGSSEKAALPAIVILHGGPWVRGSDLSWDVDAQFLASRGYRVLEPEFRGSTGYGFNHFRAGWKAWGTTMQDDVKDVVGWAAAQGLIDPGRVCLYGASYGGYAALMGPIRYPQAYRCAVSFVGVTDLELMYSSGHSDLSAQAKRYSMPVLLGDPVADAELLRAASPLQRVGEIKIPILLAHGGKDRRVPIEHADRFAAAAKRAGVPIEVVSYPHEGHGWYDAANHFDFLNRMEAFLARSLVSP